MLKQHNAWLGVEERYRQLNEGRKVHHTLDQTIIERYKEKCVMSTNRSSCTNLHPRLDTNCHTSLSSFNHRASQTLEGQNMMFYCKNFRWFQTLENGLDWFGDILKDSNNKKVVKLKKVILVPQIKLTIIN